jgi:S1-C subfamily serine protease
MDDKLSRSPAERKEKRMKSSRPQVLAMVSLVLVGVLVAVGLAVFVILDLRRNARVEEICRPLMAQVGFKCGTPHLNGREVFMITEAEPGKPMAEAGVRTGDLIQGYRDTRVFLEDLEKSRGGALTFDIEREGKRMRITVRVPPASSDSETAQ